jgi:hypothetical protein
MERKILMLKFKYNFLVYTFSRIVSVNTYRTNNVFHRNSKSLVSRLTIASEGVVKDMEFKITNADK